MLSIGVLNSKGGVGKTTLSTSLACCAASDGFNRVIIHNIDAQEGTPGWFQRRMITKQENPSAIAAKTIKAIDLDNPRLLTGEQFASDAFEKAQLDGCDFLIFDGTPGSLTETENAMQLVDLVVIPTLPTVGDNEETLLVIDACEEYGVDFILIVNRSEKDKTRGADTIHGLIADNSKRHVFETPLPAHEHFQLAMDYGLSISEVPRAQTSASIVEALYKRIKPRARAANKARE